MTVGFIGQGYVGKNYADDFECRGLKVVRYSLEEPYLANKDAVGKCDVVFVAVPTPTTPQGFNTDTVEEALSLIAAGKIAVIKSTILPGVTKRLQEKHKEITILFSPEFLGESTAAYDAAHPWANVIGLPVDDEKHRTAAELVRPLLPPCDFFLICDSTEAELSKYAHNTSGFIQIVTFNLFYDMAKRAGARWEEIQKIIEVDPYISNRYAYPVHKSGRGAGGHCFIKDFAAIREFYERAFPEDKEGQTALRALEQKNIGLLRSTGKDLPLIDGVYGKLKN